MDKKEETIIQKNIEKETRKLEVMYEDRLAGIISLEEYMKNANRIKEIVKSYEIAIKEFEQELRCSAVNFVKDVYALVGDEYTVLGNYINNKTKSFLQSKKPYFRIISLIIIQSSLLCRY